MSNYPSLSDWMDAVVESSGELATTMLGMSGSKVIRTHDELVEQGNAAYISVVGELSAVQIGVGASTENCQSLAKALMGMEPDEEDLESEEVTDAFGEIANILAGQVKSVIAKKTDMKMNLGIPIFVKGELYLPDSSEIKIIEAEMGDVSVQFLVMKNVDLGGDS